MEKLLELENVIGIVVTLEIAKEELLYGRSTYKNPEGYTWNKTYIHTLVCFNIWNEQKSRVILARIIAWRNLVLWSHFLTVYYAPLNLRCRLENHRWFHQSL